jgi:hypothetical protein
MRKALETLGDSARVRVQGRRQRLLVVRRRIASSVRARAYAMAIGPHGAGFRLTACAGRVLRARGHEFVLELKQPRFDRTGTTKPPQQACQPMNKLELDRRARINTAD